MTYELKLYYKLAVNFDKNQNSSLFKAKTKQRNYVFLLWTELN
jgi:hypothetical protein